MQSGKLNILQLYASTADKEDHKIEKFYKEVDIILKLIKKHVLGDMNVKIGKGKFKELVGEYELEKKTR